MILPVPTLRPGQASIPIEITWAQAGCGDAVRIELPRFADLSVMNGLVQVIPPAGYRVEREGGSLHPVARGAAMEQRSQRVIEELARLRKQGDELSAAGLERLNTNLALLEQELADYTGQMQRLETMPAYGVKQSQILRNRQNIETAQFEQARVLEIQHGRQGRDRALDRHAIRRDWRPPAAAAPAGQHHLPLPDWLEADVRHRDGPLGPGEPPPGLAARRTVRLHGIDLLGDPDGTPQTFQGQTGELSLVLTIEREASTWWRWLLGACALALVTLAAWRWPRPRRTVADADRLFR